MANNPYLKVSRRFFEAGRLASVHLDLTYRCDLNCIHCYLDDRTRPGPSTQVWLDVIDDLARMGVFGITLSGGEVFLRKDIWTLLKRLKSHRFYVRLKTHGMKIDAEFAQKLRDHAVHGVDLSLYSLEPGPHDEIVRRKGAQVRTRAAIDHLLGAGIDVRVNNVVMEANRDGHRELHAEMLKKGVLSSYTGMIRGFQGGGTEVYSVGLCLSDLIKIEADQLEDHKADTPAEVTQKFTPQPHNEAIQCGAGNFNLYVDPDGNVTPCVSWPMTLGNIGEQSISEIWEKSRELEQIKQLRQSDRKGCHGCSYRQGCSYCPGMAYIETGSATSPAEALCRTAQARAMAQKQLHLGGSDRRVFFPIAKQKTNAERAKELEAILAEEPDCTGTNHACPSCS